MSKCNILNSVALSREVRKKRVNCIAETSNRQLWVGNGVGLWRLNRSNGELQRIVPEKIDFAVNTLLADNDVLYLGTEKGLFIQKDGQLIQIQTDPNVLAACNRVMDLCLNEDKSVLWMAFPRKCTRNRLFPVSYPNRGNALYRYYEPGSTSFRHPNVHFLSCSLFGM